MSASSTCTATVTGKIGPGNSLSAAVISNILEFSFDVVNNLLKYRIGTTWNQIDISLATTVTCTLSAAAGNYTLTVS